MQRLVGVDDRVKKKEVRRRLPVQTPTPPGLPFLTGRGGDPQGIPGNTGKPILFPILLWETGNNPINRCGEKLGAIPS